MMPQGPNSVNHISLQQVLLQPIFGKEKKKNYIFISGMYLALMMPVSKSEPVQFNTNMYHTYTHWLMFKLPIPLSLYSYRFL